jgi:hypothetical protein
MYASAGALVSAAVDAALNGAAEAGACATAT